MENFLKEIGCVSYQEGIWVFNDNVRFYLNIEKSKIPNLNYSYMEITDNTTKNDIVKFIADTSVENYLMDKAENEYYSSMRHD